MTYEPKPIDTSRVALSRDIEQLTELLAKNAHENWARLRMGEGWRYGVGIDAADQKRIFDPFFTTKLGKGGSGLGLHIVYNLVTGVLGGEISVDSQRQTGTRFIVVAPLTAPQRSDEE